MFKGIPDATVALWYEQLKSRDITFTTAFPMGESSFPIVVVRLSDEVMENQPLGFYTSQVVQDEEGTSYETLGFIAKQIVTIYIFSESFQRFI